MYGLVEITRVPTGPGKSWCFKSVLESPVFFFCFFRKIVEKSRNFTQYLSDDFFFEVI